MGFRFAGWANGWYDYPDYGHGSGSAQGAFGFEYLSFVRHDLGVGIAVTVFGRAQGDWNGRPDAGSAQIVTGIPVVARWYPIRRLTRTRSVEPYVSAGIGNSRIPATRNSMPGSAAKAVVSSTAPAGRPSFATLRKIQ